MMKDFATHFSSNDVLDLERVIGNALSSPLIDMLEKRERDSPLHPRNMRRRNYCYLQWTGQISSQPRPLRQMNQEQASVDGIYCCCHMNSILYFSRRADSNFQITPSQNGGAVLFGNQRLRNMRDGFVRWWVLVLSLPLGVDRVPGYIDAETGAKVWACERRGSCWWVCMSDGSTYIVMV